MRVLDVGSGMGDVALLVAELVGLRGEVIGTDLAPEMVAAASHRARLEARMNVSFLVGDPSEISFPQPFDAVVGRYVLMYQRDPATTLQGLASQVRPGGLIVFHKFDWGGARSCPAVPTYHKYCRWVVEGLQHGNAEAYMGSKLYTAFAQAGLPAPVMRLEAVIGGPSDPSCAVRDLLATIFPASLIPTLERHNVTRAAEVGAETLPERMAAEMAELGSVVVGRSEVGAWTRRPPSR
jgi:SAM-dependent methyltransferase